MSTSIAIQRNQALIEMVWTLLIGQGKRISREMYMRLAYRCSIVSLLITTGVEWAPTEHRYEFASLAWTVNDGELVRREINGALDAPAESIWLTYYVPAKLPDETVKEPRKSVQAAGPLLEDFRQLLNQQ